MLTVRNTRAAHHGKRSSKSNLDCTIRHSCCSATKGERAGCQWPPKMSGQSWGAALRRERSDRSGAACRVPKRLHDLVSPAVDSLFCSESQRVDGLRELRVAVPAIPFPHYQVKVAARTLPRRMACFVETQQRGHRTRALVTGELSWPWMST